MQRDTARRAELVERATDHVLAHGLIGLSLRPLAAALGTSDRMLLYHFGSKDALVVAVLLRATDRSMEHVAALPPSPDVRRAVLRLWDTVSQGEPEACHRLYVEGAALGLLGLAPYSAVVKDANDRWLEAAADRLVAAGCPRRRARRVANLVDAAFMGFQLELPLYRGTAELRRAVSDVADAAAAVAAS